MRKLQVEFQVPNWTPLLEPNGRLVDTPECKALFYYYTVAIQTWKKEETALVLEGELDPIGNYERLFRNAAKMYHADVEKMANYWMLVEKEIDRQSVALVLQKGGHALSKLPEMLKFRNKKIEIETRRLN